MKVGSTPSIWILMPPLPPDAPVDGSGPLLLAAPPLKLMAAGSGQPRCLGLLSEKADEIAPKTRGPTSPAESPRRRGAFSAEEAPSSSPSSAKQLLPTLSLSSKCLPSLWTTNPWHLSLAAQSGSSWAVCLILWGVPRSLCNPWTPGESIGPEHVKPSSRRVALLEVQRD